jgi:transcriptional repressor NrdR
MKCPFCGAFNNRVIDSRLARDGLAIRRRRECENCVERFTTYEVVDHPVTEVEKTGGRIEPFEAEKLLWSLKLATKKRPVPLEALAGFVERLELRLHSQTRRVVKSEELGEEVLAFLYELDPVAYVRYASVYRSFATVDAFKAEISKFQVPGEAE